VVVNWEVDDDALFLAVILVMVLNNGDHHI
jgi:hypothetical protein